MRLTRVRTVAAWVALTLVATTASRGDDASSGKELDSKIDRGIYKSIVTGVTLYNGGDQAGCYRVYQGTLMAIEPMLGHRPDLAAAVSAGLRDVEGLPTYAQRATELRKVLDKVLAEVRGGKSQAQPLWARLGGEPAVKAVVHDFVVLAAGDPRVDFLRGGKYQLDAAGVANLEKQLVDLISAVTGGPLKYEGKGMKEVHEGMGITNAQFDALAADLIAVLKKYNVPQKELNELVGIVASTRKDIVEVASATPTPAPPPPTASLWARLGGEPAVKAVIHDFVALAAGDPKVDFLRGGKYKLDDEGVANLEKQLVDFVSSATGGPLKYEGKGMKEAHEGMGITDAQFNALAADLIAVLKKYKVPQKEIDELIKVVGSTRGDIVENTPAEAPAAAVDPNSLWARLGGEPAVKAVIHDFVALAAGDPKVDFLRGGKYQLDAAGVANLEKQLVDLVSATTGGPLKYEGKGMKEVHEGMGITDSQFNAIAADLIAVLRKYKVPKKETDELIGIIASTRKDIVEPGK